MAQRRRAVTRSILVQRPALIDSMITKEKLPIRVLFLRDHAERRAWRISGMSYLDMSIVPGP
jgi:hypothetical protein